MIAQQSLFGFCMAPVTGAKQLELCAISPASQATRHPSVGWFAMHPLFPNERLSSGAGWFCLDSSLANITLRHSATCRYIRGSRFQIQMRVTKCSYFGEIVIYKVGMRPKPCHVGDASRLRVRPWAGNGTSLVFTSMSMRRGSMSCRGGFKDLHRKPLYVVFRESWVPTRECAKMLVTRRVM